MPILAALFILLFAGNADADWLVAAFTGQSHTNSNTLTIAGPATQLTLGPVDYRGEGFKSPIYYGYRVGWAPGARGFGVEGEWVHAKARGTTNSILLTTFDQSHGLNFVLLGATYRQPLTGGRVALVARGGGGFTTPHVEGTFLGTHTESYQYGGLAWHGGGGLEIQIARGLTALADVRVTSTAETLDVAGLTVDGTFVTSHLSFGVGWRFGR